MAKRYRRVLVAALVVSALSAVGATAHWLVIPYLLPPPTFAVVPEAVEFIAECLDKGDYSGLSAACVGGGQSGPQGYLATHRRVFDTLRSAHERTPLQGLYAKRTFPEGQSTFKLGGHMSEIGSIHIDFIRIRGDWHLQGIWACR